MRHSLLLIVILFLLTGCVSERLTVRGASAKYAIPFEWPRVPEQDKVLFYPGMSRRELYRAFDRSLQKSLRSEGSEEWITFIDWTTENPNDLITFYLVDGKVKEWKEK